MASLHSKVALVSGVSSGIGQSIARALVRSGFRVFGTSRNAGGIEGVSGVDLLPLDVGADESVRSCVQTVLARAGRIDCLVNNAGYVLGGAAEEVSIEEAKRQFETNFFGVMRMVKAVLPAMRLQQRGRIINISSLAGLVAAPPFWGVYAASKWALEAYSEHLRREVKPFGIGVSVVEPGSIKTNLTRNQSVAAAPIRDYDPWRERAFAAARRFEGNAPDPSVVADCVLRIVEARAPRLRYRVGAEATWVPRLHRIVPAAVFEKLIKRLFDIDIATTSSRRGASDRGDRPQETGRA
jgi:NAD(P)-dependent dehydrogenase (short-subunit alcohol dehydrogenase family)